MPLSPASLTILSVAERTRMQDELAPICVWVVTEPPDEERRCGRDARWRYSKEVQLPGKLPSKEVYTMCGKHASEANRVKAHNMGYTVERIVEPES